MHGAIAAGRVRRHFVGASIGDDQAMREAITAYRAALEVDTRASNPAMWAASQNNLGVALTTLGERGDDRASHEAIEALRTELRQMTSVLRSEVREGLAENRRYLEVVTESLHDDIRLIAEGLVSLDAKIERYFRSAGRS